ncbi:MAG: hypothetical protein R2727_01065 [Bacteroidales bacterium]
MPQQPLFKASYRVCILLLQFKLIIYQGVCICQSLLGELVPDIQIHPGEVTVLILLKVELICDAFTTSAPGDLNLVLQVNKVPYTFLIFIIISFSFLVESPVIQ